VEAQIHRAANSQKFAEGREEPSREIMFSITKITYEVPK